MMYIDLDEIDQALDRSPLWSARHPALAWFRRKDFFNDGERPLAVTIRDHVKKETGVKLNGPVRLLANLRYFGFIINPICCYYCFDESGDTLRAIVFEVTNTPWGERYHYTLLCDQDNDAQQLNFNKEFHVSPFLPMDMQYKCQTRAPGKNLTLHLENHQSENKIFDATLVMKQQQITSARLNKLILQYPFMTIKVFMAIYWQALKLFIKKIPFYNHPRNTLQKLQQHEY